jgi:hypothetical protein
VSQSRRGAKPPEEMLTIRYEQMQALEGEMDRAFAERLARIVSSLFPHYFERIQGTQGAADYPELVGKAIERAERFGISQETDIAAFVVLTMAARNFDDPADGFLDWTHPIIMNEAIAGAAKISLIKHRLEREATADPCAARVVEMLQTVRAND